VSQVKIQGNASGTGAFTIAAPNSNTDRTLTLPDATGTSVLDTASQTLTNKTLGSGLVMGASAITAGTVVASTSGTSIDFTSIPSWVKRVTVMCSGVSTNGSSQYQVQLGDSGGIENTGYTSNCVALAAPSTVAIQTLTSGIPILYTTFIAASTTFTTTLNISLLDSATNLWVFNANSARTDALGQCLTSGSKSLSATLDRVRITTVNGTDTFDAGSINILWE
jgi:hypothetical protein